MTFKTLVTLNGTAPFDSRRFDFTVVDGGALKITEQGGGVDLIGPGFWIAVVDDRGEDRLDWEFLAPQSSRE